MRYLDRTDARILLALDEDPAATTLSLSRSLRLARNTVHARLRRLEADGVLAPPSRRVDPAALGRPLLAFATMQIAQGNLDETLDGLRGIPEILELVATTGDGDLLARVVARDPEDLHHITRRMLGVPGVVRTSTVMAMRMLLPHRTAPLLRDELKAGEDGEFLPRSAR